MDLVVDPVDAFRSANRACESMLERMRLDPNNVTDDMRRDFVLASLATSAAACDAAEYANQTKTPRIMADEARVLHTLHYGLNFAEIDDFMGSAGRARRVSNDMEHTVHNMRVAANRWHRDAVSVNSEIDDVAMRIDPARIHASDDRLINVIRILDECRALSFRIHTLHDEAIDLVVDLRFGRAAAGADARRSSVTRCSKGKCNPPRRSQGGSRKKRKTRKTHKRR